MLCRLDPPSDMSAADSRHAGNVSGDTSVTWAMSWLAQDDIGRHLSWCTSFTLASQMSWREIRRHVTKIDSQSRCRQHVGCRPKQGDMEWREDMSADMSPTFPTQLQAVSQAHETLLEWLRMKKVTVILTTVHEAVGRIAHENHNV